MRFVVSTPRAFAIDNKTSGFPISGGEAGLGFWAALIPVATAVISTAGTIAAKRYDAKTSEAQASGAASTAYYQAQLEQQRQNAVERQRQDALELERIRLQQQQMTAQENRGWVIPVAVGGATLLVVTLMMTKRRR